MAKAKTFTDKMQDLYGDDYNKVFITGEDKVEPIPTGALSLDTSIGIGGIPKGRFTTIYGPEGSGKSTIALSICREAMRKGERVLYIDVENQMFMDYIEQLLGESFSDGGLFTISKPETSDDAFNILEAAINSGDFSLVVLDSIAALATPEEMEKKFDESTMAIIPRDLSKFFRRNAYKVREKNIAILFINQVRDSIGSYVKTYTMPGGHALLHYSSLLIPISKAQEIKAGESTIGIMTKFTIKKNKMAPPFRSYLIPIIFGKGIDSMRDLISYAEFLGVLQKAGPYYRFGETMLGKGVVATMDFLESNQEVLDKIKEMCYNIVGKYNNQSETEGELDE